MISYAEDANIDWSLLDIGAFHVYEIWLMLYVYVIFCGSGLLICVWACDCWSMINVKYSNLWSDEAQYLEQMIERLWH